MLGIITLEKRGGGHPLSVMISGFGQIVLIFRYA